MPSATIFAKYICDQGINSVIAINKLLYISFGFFGAYHDKFLFEDRIEAWEFGPVVPDTWYGLKKSRKEFAQINPSLDTDQQRIINRVVHIYGKKAPYLLDELTDKENTPWSEVYKPCEKSVINKERIIRYYKRLLSPLDKLVERMVEDDFKEIMRNLSQT